MSIRFAIKNTAGKATKEGDSFIRYTGTGEPFSRNCERTARAVETDALGIQQSGHLLQDWMKDK